MDILSNLAVHHSGDSAYGMNKEVLYNGGDSMEFHDYLVKVQKACKGK